MRELRAEPRIATAKVGSAWEDAAGPFVIRVAEGQILVRGGGDLIRAGRGDLVCSPCAVSCALRRLDGSPRIERLVLDPAWLERALELTVWGQPRSDEPPGPAFRVDRSGTDRARRAARLIREIGHVEGADADGAPILLAARCIELLGLALLPPTDATAAGAAARGLDRREHFLHAVEALGKDSFGDLNLCAFARRAGISERHASRLFQEEIGRTFREHVAVLRLERAKALLRNTEMSVIDVAGETGWSSLAHFNSVFRRRVGSTPSQFRGRSTARDPARIAS
jgi:AraC-like DNA-binding protein